MFGPYFKCFYYIIMSIIDPRPPSPAPTPHPGSDAYTLTIATKQEMLKRFNPDFGMTKMKTKQLWYVIYPIAYNLSWQITELVNTGIRLYRAFLAFFLYADQMYHEIYFFFIFLCKFFSSGCWNKRNKYWLNIQINIIRENNS